MQAMDEEPEPPIPVWVSITSETTALDVEPRPPGGAGPRVELLLHLAMMECHTWLGMGGRSARVRRPRRLSRKRWIGLDDNDECRCRYRIGRTIMNSLSEEEEYDSLSPARWNEAVPLGVERDIAEAVHRDGGGGATIKVVVHISISFEFVYSEIEALMLACVQNGGADTAGRSGDAPSLCPICLEEMSGEVTNLPGCTHGFHPLCIATWFHKAATCPVCRRDQLQYLSPDYRDLHDKMTIDPDSLPDYL